MNKPHKHAALIKAWADGAEIEFRWDCLNDWRRLTTPRWDQDGDYRIKPEPKPDVVMYGYVCTKGVWRVSIYRGDGDNIKVTFDGDTGKLKAAEVLQ
jgi:hypothetical protein